MCANKRVLVEQRLAEQDKYQVCQTQLDRDIKKIDGRQTALRDQCCSLYLGLYGCQVVCSLG